MVSVSLFIRAAAVAMVSSTAYAADLPLPPPQYQPVVVEQPAGAWYLRGDIGVGMMTNADLEYIQNPLNHSNFAIQHAAIGDTTFFMAGIGYEWNNWLRFDVTAEYRNRAPFNAFGTYTFGGGTFGDAYQGFLKSAVFLGNAYIDLGTWNCLTPFVGVGVGGAWNQFADLTDTGIGTSGTGIGRNTTHFDFAWALHAGLAYNVTQNFTVEFAYRYLNFGSVTDTIDCAGGCNPDSYKLKNLSSNDFMLGMRWRFVPTVPVQPIIQPPLSTRG